MNQLKNRLNSDHGITVSNENHNNQLISKCNKILMQLLFNKALQYNFIIYTVFTQKVKTLLQGVSGRIVSVD